MSMDLFEKVITVSMSTPLGIGPTAPFNPVAPWGINVNAIGGSGVGKSGRIRAIGKSLGMNVYPIFSATKTPEHIGGFPVMTPAGFSLECALPQVRAAMDDGNAIIFLDEISSAPPAVQAALLSFVNERTIGEYVLPPKVRILLAMNPADIAANGRDLEVPMANRVLHFNYTPPPKKQWVDLMAGIYSPETGTIKDNDELVRKHWREHFGTVLEIVDTFLDASGGSIKERDEDGKEVTRSKFYDQPNADDPRASKAWPSHRTWHWALNSIVAARCLGMDISVQQAMVEGLIGAGIASEWAAYVKKANLPHPHDVLTNGWTVPKQLDVVRIVAMSCATYTAQEEDPALKAQYAAKCLRLFQSICDAQYNDLIPRPFTVLLHNGIDLFHPDKVVQDHVEQIASLLNMSGHVKYVGKV